VRPGHSARSKIRLTGSGTDLITILRCFLSFKTVVTSRNIIVFKIKFSRKKLTIRVSVGFLVPRPAATLQPSSPLRSPRLQALGQVKTKHWTSTRVGRGAWSVSRETLNPEPHRLAEVPCGAPLLCAPKQRLSHKEKPPHPTKGKGCPIRTCWATAGAGCSRMRLIQNIGSRTAEFVEEFNHV
jgi:hypothetical protein